MKIIPNETQIAAIKRGCSECPHLTMHEVAYIVGGEIAKRHGWKIAGPLVDAFTAFETIEEVERHARAHSERYETGSSI